MNQESLGDKLTNDLEAFYDNVKKQNLMYFSSRSVVITRIRMIIMRKFNADIKLYGSCATGIEVLESDIDLAIIGILLSSYEIKGCEILSRA